jgi:transposase InsO family protein
VLELRREFALPDLLHAAQLPRSTFYYQVKALAMPDKHDELKASIRAVYAEHRGLYGYRRVTAAIRRGGRVVNHKTVQRLMSDMGMKSRVRPKKFRSYRGELGQAVPNCLNRGFTASQANQKWVTDVTEFSVAGKKLYLSPVMDLYNGEIVAYEISRRPDFSLVMSMLKKAARKCSGMDGPLLHSDQGWHYRMQPYRAALARYGMKQSMSRKGNCFDNAAMESFFATLKAEYFHLSAFKDVEQLDAGLKSYIDYYNRHRIKLKLRGMSPVEYRLQAACN